MEVVVEFFMCDRDETSYYISGGFRPFSLVCMILHILEVLQGCCPRSTLRSYSTDKPSWIYCKLDSLRTVCRSRAPLAQSFQSSAQIRRSPVPEHQARLWQPYGPQRRLTFDSPRPEQSRLWRQSAPLTWHPECPVQMIKYLNQNIKPTTKKTTDTPLKSLTWTELYIFLLCFNNLDTSCLCPGPARSQTPVVQARSPTTSPETYSRQ